MHVTLRLPSALVSFLKERPNNEGIKNFDFKKVHTQCGGAEGKSAEQGFSRCGSAEWPI